MAFPPICCALADKEKGGGGREQQNKRGRKKKGFLSQTVPKAAPCPCKAGAHPAGQRTVNLTVDSFASSAARSLAAAQDVIPGHVVRDADIDPQACGERC